jgi:hypothetical protein
MVHQVVGSILVQTKGYTIGISSFSASYKEVR